jgi:hypothetical protein
MAEGYQLLTELDTCQPIPDNLVVFWNWWDRNYGLRNRLRFALRVLTDLVDEGSNAHLDVVQAIATCQRCEQVLLIDDQAGGSLDVLELSLFANAVNALVWGELMANGKIYRPAPVSLSIHDVVRVSAASKRAREDGDLDPTSLAGGEEEMVPETPPHTQPTAAVEPIDEEGEEEDDDG